MQDVPKIVRERLKAAMPVVGHPDADVLTAFTEQSLGESERAIVLEHLASCGDCRDIVALALPASEEEQTVTRTAARGWLSWPALRWGMVAAGILAIGSLGIVRLQRRPQQMASKTAASLEVAKNESKDLRAAPGAPAVAAVRADSAATADNEASAQPLASSNSGSRDTALFYEKKNTVHVPAAAPLNAPRREGGNAGLGQGSGGGIGNALGSRQLAHGPRLANQFQQNQVQNGRPAPAPAPSVLDKQQAAGDLSANMKVPASTETVEVEAAAPTEVQGKSLPELPNQRTAYTSLSEGNAKDKVGKAKPALTVGNTSGSAGASSMAAAPTTVGGLLASSMLPRWTIDSEGHLQRSFDKGSTWQAVDVNANPSAMSSALEVSAESPRAKTKMTRKAKEPTGIIFRGVAANGAEVWAGGSAGALYHSMDSGEHWTRVVPATSSAALTGDIVRVDFSDARHGSVGTSTSEVWTTADDGQSWQKQ